MKNSYIIIIACALLAVAFFADFYFFSNGTKNEHFANDLFKKTEVEAKNIAEKWIVEKSPTYMFDGANLVFKESKKGSCDTCSIFSFSFESSHGGYGNREGLIITQAIAPHVTEVEIKDSAVVRVITDKKYNEITGAFAE